MKAFDHHVGIVLKQVRNREGLTQQELADLSSTSRGFISDVERGEKGISLEKFLHLCAAFPNTSANDFLDLLTARIDRYANPG